MANQGAPPPRSAAVQIVKPSSLAAVKEFTPAALSGAAFAAGKEFVPSAPVSGDKGSKKVDGKQKICRNVVIYGSCRFQDQGCIYYHPPPGEISTSSAESPSLANLSLTANTSASTTDSKSSNFAEHLSAPVFVPKLAPPGGDVTQSRAESPMNPLWSGNPSLSLGEGSSSDIQPQMFDESLLGLDHSLSMEQSMYMPPQPIRQPLDYHLYVSPLPHVANPPTSHNPLHAFFIPDDIRRTLQARQEASYGGVIPTPGLPSVLHNYHSLVAVNLPFNQLSRVYGYPNHIYRATSSRDGNVYCLRRVEGFKLVNEAAFATVESWRRLPHPNIVSLREAFTTKAFQDNSLVLVYDFHPDSTTLWDEHLNPESPLSTMGRRRLGMPIAERLLWSYITQITNALKAIHSSGLAARNLDPSKILITGKNRIRLNGVGVWDILVFDPNAHIAQAQQEDLVSFGKLILSLCCEFYVPGSHPAAPLDHISRNYSQDVKNLVMFLMSKPGPLKTVDEVMRLAGPRILNEIDALQNYVDVLESEMGAEVENGRVVRLLTKLGFINERAEFELDPRWSDTGDRYILKLFRDYVFHSVGIDGHPVLDISHVLTCLNKLDAGLDEKIMLVSRDDQSCLVVSYREIKVCIEAAYNELKNAGNPMRGMR